MVDPSVSIPAWRFTRLRSCSEPSPPSPPSSTTCNSLSATCSKRPDQCEGRGIEKSQIAEIIWILHEYLKCDGKQTKMKNPVEKHAFTHFYLPMRIHPYESYSNFMREQIKTPGVILRNNPCSENRYIGQLNQDNIPYDRRFLASTLHLSFGCCHLCPVL